MKGNYKIVVNTAAGRRRYLQYLIPFVVSNELVDRYDLWVNTTDKLDICIYAYIFLHKSIAILIAISIL